MRLGVAIGYWGLGLTSEQQLALVQEAERLDYDSVWAAEAYGSDCATVLAWLAGQTSKIRLGAGHLPDPGPLCGDDGDDRRDARSAFRRPLHPRCSEARGPQVAEGWHGQRFGKQLQRTREYIDVVRMALARERVEYDGETLTLPLPDGPGKALRLTIDTVQEQIPIYLAAIGPKNTELAARDRRRLAADPV